MRFAIGFAILSVMTKQREFTMSTALALNTNTSRFSEISVFNGEDKSHGFYKVTDVNALASLFDAFDKERIEIQNLCQFVSQNGSRALDRLFGANKPGSTWTEGNLFNLKGGMTYLTAIYWKKALELTDVYDHMPQANREEWDEKIEKKETPEFTKESVITTLQNLLNERDFFLAKRVDGIFRNLSGDHVTNKPMGFSMRMILSPMFEQNKEPSESNKGYIADLRVVINRFLGRPINESNSLHNTKTIIAHCQQKDTYGQWMEVDGGALKIKVFKKGTIHAEIHPDLAWRLNQMLAMLYPVAIPPQFRKPNAKVLKAKPLQFNLISEEAIKLIGRLKHPHIAKNPENLERSSKMVDKSSYCIHRAEEDMYEHPQHVIDEARNVLFSCGATEFKTEYGVTAYKFGFDIGAMVSEIITSSVMPEAKSHQYYPTNEELAQEAVEWCDIEDHHDALEPSTGQGGLAKFMPKSTTCVEISGLHCAILQGKGHNVVEADFLLWAQKAPLFDRICMNPPFTAGQAKVHVEVAAGLLKKNGVLVAIVPNSLKSKLLTQGYSVQWSRDIHGAFSGTGTNVTVAMVRIVKL